MEGLTITLGSVGGMPRQMNNGITFLLVLRGALDLEHNGQRYTLSKNDVVVLGQGDLFALSGQKPNVLLFINVSGEYMLQHLPGALSGAIRCSSYGLDQHHDRLYAPIKKNVARMAFIHYQQEKGYELLLQSVLYETLHMLARDFSQETTPAHSQTTAYERLQASLAYIHQNYKSRISLEEAARREFMSVQYLSRLFREQLGTTFMEYLNALRVSGAERELVFTKDTITRVALNNGFASARALGEQFARKHGCTPAEYRKAYQGADASGAISDIRRLEGQDGGSLEALVKFIDSHNIDLIENVQAHYTLDLGRIPTSLLPDFQALVEIGDIDAALRADVRRQLEEAGRRLRLSGVSFGGFIRALHNMAGSPDLFKTYDFYEALSAFHRLGLTPFIRLEMAELELFESPAAGIGALCALLGSLQLRYSAAALGRWHFEVLGTGAQPGQYAKLYTAIKAVNGDIRVGLRMDPFLPPEGAAVLRTETGGAPPDFFGFTFDPNEEHRPADGPEFDAFFRAYHTRAAQAVRHCADEAGYPGCPLYLMQWNTLTGKTAVEAGEFHRTALMADVLTALMGKIAGAAVRLSLYADEPLAPGLMTRPLSLYVSKDIRRPMFFITKAMASLKPQIVWRGENGLLTRDGQDRYALLLYNACYIDPFRALDNIRLRGNVLSCSLTLEGLTPGRYRIKEHLMDKDKGSFYHNALKLDFSVPLDEEDWDEYIESISSPSVALWEAEARNGALSIRAELDINATALFIIKRFA